jgi:DNA repair protein SbcD/Mre11
MLDSPPPSGGCDVRVLFVSDTHIGLDWPARPRVVRRRRGDDFFENFERALEPARSGEVDVVVHGGDLLYRSRVPAWLAETALAPLKRLASSGVPVLLVPGNHERGRIPYPLLAVHERLHVFDRPRSVVLEAGGVRVAFIGFPYAHNIRHRFPQMLAAARSQNTTADVGACGRGERAMASPAAASGGGAPRALINVLCLHHSVEGATCGPGNFTFRFGIDVVRIADLPRDVTVILSGHIHRHQVLRPAGRPPVIYAGSVERTSLAEAHETKGFVVLQLTQSGLGSFEFRPLPARPMVARAVNFDDADPVGAHAHVAAVIGSTPCDAVVHLRVTGAMPATLTAAALRGMAGARTVTLSVPRAERISRLSGSGGR